MREVKLGCPSRILSPDSAVLALLFKLNPSVLMARREKHTNRAATPD
jgi:hypothetical protein